MKAGPNFLVNFAAFQIGWFACVLGGANDLALAGTLTVAAIVALHLYLSSDPATELRLLTLIAVIGTAWDSLVVSSGVMSYPSGSFLAGFAPHWIIAMWVLFGTTLNVSMGWLKGRPIIAAIMGAVGGPLAYLTGYKLGGVAIPDLTLGLVVQGAGWAILMPLLTLLADAFNGVSMVKNPAYANDNPAGQQDV